jgi:hypothetical protein
MEKISVARMLFLVLTLTLLAGCGGGSNSSPLSADNINLIFVVTPDLANDPLGDINTNTGNLSNQGLQRSLLMATYLKQQLLGSNNVTRIYALAPMTHLQTANNYPDMAAIGFIQQFALLNRQTVLGAVGNSYSLNVAYATGDVPAGVATPDPYVPGAQGLAFNDAHGNNAALATGIINAGVPGFYVFSAPWQTISTLLTSIKTAKGYGVTLPTTYQGPNFVYVMSVTPSGSASLNTFDSRVAPSATYPVLPASVTPCPCTQQTYFSYTRTAGVNGVVIPPNINTNQTIYMIRHAEAHPASSFENGNYVGAGQWRALALPNFLAGALRGQSSPTMVYSVDPAQSFPVYNFSYVRPSLTVLPYAIANNLPYNLAASFLMNPDATSEPAAENAKNFFFTNTAGVNLSNQTILLAWEHEHFPLLIKHLIDSYGGTVPSPTLTWPAADYDTIWTVQLDNVGNLTVHNALCEGIDSTKLPATAPLF